MKFFQKKYGITKTLNRQDIEETKLSKQYGQYVKILNANEGMNSSGQRMVPKVSLSEAQVENLIHYTIGSSSDYDYDIDIDWSYATKSRSSVSMSVLDTDISELEDEEEANGGDANAWNTDGNRMFENKSKEYAEQLVSGVKTFAKGSNLEKFVSENPRAKDLIAENITYTETQHGYTVNFNILKAD